MIYFDNAASSYKKPKAVIDAINFALLNLTANPGRSGHDLSIAVGEVVYETRELIKQFLKADDYQVVFTKNCTEALNLAIRSFLSEGDTVIITTYEHNSVLRTLYSIKGLNVIVLNCEMSNVPTLLKQKISTNVKMVITTNISNVTGEVCDCKKVGEICKEYNVIYLVDGAQSVGHIEYDLNNMNIDMLAFAGHKGLHSITGVGGLVVKNNLKLKPLIFGGTGTESENLNQPNDIPEGLESGTLPSISIISLNAGVKYLIKNFYKISKKEQFLSQYLYEKLKKIKNLTLFSKKDSLNVFSFNIDNYDNNTIANELNEKYKICVRSGLHCAPLTHRFLKSGGAVRVSLDCFNTIDEIDKFIEVLKNFK